MEQHYDVEYRGQKAGKVSIGTKGLYYAISCRTGLPGLRLYLQASEGVVDLGICVPKEGMYGFDVLKPRKSVPGNIEKFFLSGQKKHGCLIDPSKPFACLHLVAEGKLQIENGKYYLYPSTVT